VRFCLLGPLLAYAGDELRAVTAPHQRVLLAALLLNAGRVLDFDELADIVWNGDPPKGNRGALHNAVRRLRVSLGADGASVILTRPPGYLCELGKEDLDVRVFETLVDSGHAALRARQWQLAADVLRRALELWRGNALADVPSRILHEEFGRALEEQRLTALGARLDADLHLGRQGELVPELTRLVERYPLREVFHEQLMLALYRIGRQADALEVYRRARRLLHAELGVEPGRAMQELHAGILAADPALETDTAPRPAAAAAPAHAPAPAAGRSSLAQLPADLADFTGRADEIAAITDLLVSRSANPRPSAVVVTAVSGIGGVGKTALAVHAAHALRDRFPDGQLYADLGGFGGRRTAPGDLLARFLRDLGLTAADIPADEQERATRYRSLTADRRMLILLDNARDAAQVRPLLPGGGACRVLVTSRARLADLAGSALLDLGVLDEADGLALLTRIVGARRIAAQLKATAEILDVCAGLPLALRIAAARLAGRPNWSVQSFADRLADHRGRLDELAVGDLGVRATLELSYEDLGARRTRSGAVLVRCFHMLALTPARETGVPAAAALLDSSLQQAEEALETLVDASLLQSPSQGRYRMHDLLRVCAAERVETQERPADRDAAQDRLLNWYLRTAANAAYAMNPRRRHPALDQDTPAGEPLDFDAYDRALAWLDLEHANLVAAAAQAAARERHEIAWKLPILLFDLFNLRGHHADAINTHRAGIDAARALGDQAAEGWLLSHLSVLYSNADRPEESIACLRAALEIDRATGNRPSEAVNLVNLGFAYFVQRDFEQVVATLREAALVAAETGHRVAEAAALMNTGEAYKELGQYDQAAAFAHRSLAAHRALGDRQAEGSTLASLADIEWLRGNPHEAVSFARQALPVNRETGFRREEASTLHSLGRALAALGQTAEALESLAEAHAVYLELGDPRADRARAEIDELS